ncbi:hypothetical protein HDV01_006936 [Terramyces sp. JEL0728]|nr:hypothetical protein HDV01_006936 [Terramyces sp. JEL0728]
MKVNNTCDNCIKRKRKCDRQTPCSNCVKIKEECRYTGAKFKIQESKIEFEDRITYLEAMLFNQHLDVDNFGRYSQPVDETPPSMEIANEVQEFLFRERAELIEYLDLVWVDIDVSFVTMCAQNSVQLNYLLYAFASLKAPPNCLPVGVSQLEAAKAYIEKAESFVSNTISDYSLNSIVTFILLWIREEAKACYYLTLAVLQAREFGINSEATISNLTLFDFERAIYRKLWWTIYQYDVYLGTNKIQDKDNALYLPLADGVSELDLEDSDFGMQIMQSDHWFTPGIQNQSAFAYKVLLSKIHHKIAQFELNEYKLKLSTEKYIVKALESSLEVWRQLLPDSIKASINLLQNQASTNTLQEDAMDTPSADASATIDSNLLFLQLYYNYLNIYIRLLKIAQVYKYQQLPTFVDFHKVLEFARNSQIWIELYIKDARDIEKQSPFFCNIIILSSIPLIMEEKVSSNSQYAVMRQVLNSFTNEHDSFAGDIFDMLTNAKDIPELFAVYHEIKNARQL